MFPGMSNPCFLSPYKVRCEETESGTATEVLLPLETEEELKMNAEPKDEGNSADGRIEDCYFCTGDIMCL